ncbi:MAG: LacI family DNA-binding transcriptional regulator, partial [Bacteroidetes bacterium]|nr:LacI family DNA-binding transcriptional regulator [Fibrella sp.]
NANTREAILNAAAELDYQPNLLAQSLFNSETHIIGVIIPDIERPFFAAIVSSIQQAAYNAGYRIIICQSNETHQIEVLNVQALVASRVDGLLICHSRETESFEHIKLQHRRGIPIVHFDRVCEEVNTVKVIPDDSNGAFAVVEHLIGEGCQRIAVLAGPEALPISRNRVAGYRKALEKHRLSTENELIVYANFRDETALAALDHWLGLPVPPDAIFSVYDGGAVAILLALKQKGIKVPEQIAVAGFGNEPVSAIIEPGLTTIHQHPHQIGQLAVQLFLDQAVSQETFIPKTHVIQGELIIRQSSLKASCVRLTPRRRLK